MKKIARRSFLKIAGTVATACVVSGLSGCGAKEPLGSQSSTAGASESVTSNEVLEVASESTDSAYPTLTEVMKEYSGCGLSYPNFEELSVGMLYKEKNTSTACLIKMVKYIMFLMRTLMLFPDFIMACA